LKWYDERGENHIKRRFLKLKCFYPFRILASCLFEETLGAFLFLFLFLFLPLFSFFSFFLFNTFSLFFYALSLEDLGVLMIYEVKITSSKPFFSNGLIWNGMVMTVNILTVDVFSGMELCTPI
jgi:hypothetical protein